MVMLRSVHIILICLALLLSACAKKAAIRPPAPDYTGAVTAEAMAERIAFSNIAGMRSEVKATIYKGQEKLRTLKGALIMRMPDDMRIVLYDPFGNTAVDIVISQGILEAYVPSESTMYTGPIPSLMPPAGAEFRLKSDNKRHLLQAVIDDKVVREYSFDARTALNSRVRVREQGMPAYRADLRGHFGTLPGAMTLSYADTLKLDLVMKDAEVVAQADELSDRLCPLVREAARYLMI